MLETWKEIVVESSGTYIGYGGLLIGIVFGFIVYRTNFCTMGSISDMLTFGDFRRFRAWLLAAATAIAGAAIISWQEIAYFADSIYLTPQFNWAGNIVGGTIFGFGMVFAGGCTSRNLVRAGAGDLRSLMVILFIAIFGYMTNGGLLAPLRVSIFTPLTVDLTEYGMETQSMGEMLASITGMNIATATYIVLAILLAALLGYIFKDKDFRAAPVHIISGIGIGLCVIAGWLLTGLAFDEMADNPVALTSLTYVRPSGETLDYLMRFTAYGAPSFAVVTTLGAFLGGFIGALTKGRFALITFADTKDTLRNMFGGAMMGIGGIIALGCTLGQAVTGMSTLAAGSLISFIFIVLGAVAGMKYMEHLLMKDA